MTVSPFTPIFFTDRRADGIDCEHLQVFSVNDVIMVQVLALPNEELDAWLINEVTGESTLRIIFRKEAMGNGTIVFHTLLKPDEGIWRLHIEGIGDSEPFEVTSDESRLEDTVLIQYSMKDNRRRTDALFLIDDQRVFFDFRVPGGFKDSGWSFSVDNEQFVSEYASVYQLYGLESTQKEFTLGTSCGVPVWYGELLNRLLVCTYVYIDGVQYVRNESNVPEMEQLLEGVNSFVFRQKLQKAFVTDTEAEMQNQIVLRRSDGLETYRNTETEELRAVTV